MECNINTLVNGDREIAYYIPALFKDLKYYSYDFSL